MPTFHNGQIPLSYGLRLVPAMPSSVATCSDESTRSTAAKFSRSDAPSFALDATHTVPVGQYQEVR